MAVISLPLSFNNSFWSQDYRKGLEVLFHKLEQGVAENDEIIAFIRERAVIEGNIASAMKSPSASGAPSTGFAADDGASLLMAFRGMQNESKEQGLAHAAVAKDLHTLVVDPFQQWAQGHKDKLRQAKLTALDQWLRSYEFAQEDVHNLKELYQTKTRRADEAEDDARFAPNEVADKYTNSPRLGPTHEAKKSERQPTVSERIAQRLRDIGKATAANIADATSSEQVFDAGLENAPSPKADKGKGKALTDEPEELTASPPMLSPALPPPTLTIVPPPAPEPLLLAGLPFTPASIAQIFTQAKSGLPLRPVRFPILGEYPECFSGEDFVTWLRQHVPSLDGNLDLASAAAKDLTERENLLRRIGELGNAFENADDAFYQIRPTALTFGQAPAAAPGRSPLEMATSPLAKTSTSFVNIVSKALNSNPAEPPFLRLRKEAETAEKDYRTAVRQLDRQRLGVEERIEDLLKALQKWESERLRAVKTVLLQYQGSISSLRKAYDTSVDRSAVLVASYNPDSDLNALIERYRTGPFRPTPHIYESVAHDEADVVFGIDLRKWAEGGWSTVTGAEEKRDQIPPMLLTLLTVLIEKYQKYPEDSDKRKTWIYEVPLTSVHHLRESLNAVPTAQDIPEDLLNKYDAPVIAGAIKLWMLELNPPLGMYESWDEIRKIYPSVGAKSNAEVPEKEHFEAVQSALQKLPKVHLFVLDAIVHHFKELIDHTETDESDEVFLTKLALAVGRGIIRPRVESEMSIQDRHPTLFLIDLVTHYDQLIPPALEKKKRESERKVPTRKRTTIVDMRMRRSKLSDTSDLKDIVLAQHQAKSPPSSVRSPPASRSSFSSATGPNLSHAPEQIKIQAPVAVDSRGHGVPTALRSGSLSSSPHPGFVAPPPPPQIVSPGPPPAIIAPGPPPPLAVPPPPPIRAQDSGLPPRPMFKEPPPEVDDLPPRPSFKEPPPEFEDDDKFESPEMSPNTPSRSSSPAIGKTGLSRSASTEASRLRGPRTTRGPRVPVGGAARRDSFRPSTPPSPGLGVAGHARSGSRGSMTHKRDGSGSSFARRTMASDAEDEIVDK